MKRIPKFLTVILCTLLMLSMGSAVFAADTYTEARADKAVTVVGDTLTIILSAPEAINVSSLGVSVTAEGYEVVEGKWLLTGLISNYDYEKDKGVFTFGGAKTFSGDYFQLTLRAVTAQPDNSPVSVLTIAKNGPDTAFEETATLSAQKIVCKAGEHTFGPYQTTQTQHLHPCTTCGYTENDAHKWDEGVTIQEPTCTSEGIVCFTCTLCGYNYTDAELPATGHKAGTEWKYDENGHYHACTECGEKLDETAHTYTDTVTAPTCTEKGNTTHTCSACGYSYTDAELPAAGHEAGSEWKSDEKNHNHECTVCGEKVDEAVHDYKWVVDKEATATEKGSKHQECKVCGHKTAAVEIPAEGDIPPTGDNSCLMLLAVLMVVSAAALAVCTAKRRAF